MAAYCALIFLSFPEEKYLLKKLSIFSCFKVVANDSFSEFGFDVLAR